METENSVTDTGKSKSDQVWTVRVLGPLLASLVALGAIGYALDLFRKIGLNLFTEQFLLEILGLCLLTVFIRLPADSKKNRDSVPWYDMLAGLAGFLMSTYAAVKYEIILENLHSVQIDVVILSIVLMVLVLEGLRRTSGWVLVIIVIFFIAFALFGHLVPGSLQGNKVSFNRLVLYLAMDSNGLLGVAMVVSATVVIPFVFFGNLLTRSGGADFFTEFSTALMGRYRGGSAKIAVTASGFFGAISGSAVSNVVSTGVVTIPLMRQAGYPPYVAGAVEAVASTGGQLMPPMMGAAAFLMAEVLQIPYRDVALAALIPAILYYVALFIQTDLLAAREGIARVDESKIPRFLSVVRQGWFFSIPFIALLWSLFVLNSRPETSALYGSAALLVIGPIIGYAGKKMKITDLFKVLSSTGFAVLEIIMIGAAAGIIIGVLNISALGFALTQTLSQIGQGHLVPLLFMTGIISIILGMGMPTVGVYILLASLAAPSLIEAGAPVLAAHMFVLYFGLMSMITPPIAIAAYAAASLAKADAMQTGFAAVRLGWTAYLVPFFFIFSPELLMQGNPFPIIAAFITAVLGVWMVSAAIIGYFSMHLNGTDRFLFAMAGISLFVPATAFPGAVWTDVAGLILTIFLMGREYLFNRRRKASVKNNI
jgi:TRAP transporter 4TM/12TM fusion protein